MFEKYYESPAFGEWCRRVYGKDLKQLGCVTMDELGILYHEVELLPDSHILDMGCGAGYVSAEIAAHYNSRLTAIDPDDAITHAQKVFANNPAFNFIQGDATELHFQAAAFDLICFCDSLHLTQTDEKLYALLDKCWNILKSGGKLAIFRGNDNNQVNIWGQNNNVSLKTIDLKDGVTKFYKKALKEILAMESEISNEVPETCERIKNELLADERYIDENKIHRWLYIFTKQ